MIYRLSTNDEVHRYKKSIIIPFKGNRKVLSTSPLNGGYREDLKAIFNNDFNPGAGMLCDLKAPTYEGHMAIIAKELGFTLKVQQELVLQLLWKKWQLWKKDLRI